MPWVPPPTTWGLKWSFPRLGGRRLGGVSPPSDVCLLEVRGINIILGRRPLAGGRECDGHEDSACTTVGSCTDWQQLHALAPRGTRVHDRGTPEASLNDIKEGRPQQGWMLAWRASSRTMPRPRRGGPRRRWRLKQFGGSRRASTVQRGIWRCMMECKVGGLDHELPSGLI